MKLNLGCGLDIRTDWVNHDFYKYTELVDYAHDLNELPWPWPANSANRIAASSVFEHLEIDLITALNECWRVLKPEGVLQLKFPLYTSPFIHHDPTHRWFWSEHVIDFVDPTTKYGKKASFYTERKWIIDSKKTSERNCWVRMRPLGK